MYLEMMNLGVMFVALVVARNLSLTTVEYDFLNLLGGWTATRNLKRFSFSMACSYLKGRVSILLSVPLHGFYLPDVRPDATSDRGNNTSSEASSTVTRSPHEGAEVKQKAEMTTHSTRRKVTPNLGVRGPHSDLFSALESRL